jgi:heme exporter protein D
MIRNVKINRWYKDKHYMCGLGLLVWAAFMLIVMTVFALNEYRVEIKYVRGRRTLTEEEVQRMSRRIREDLEEDETIAK